MNSEEYYEKQVNSILKLQNEDRLNEAIAKLKKLINQFPDKAVLYGLMGGLYALDDKYTEAVPYYENLLKLNPKSERGSTGLFHALNSIQRGDEALEEMKRFLSNNNLKKDNYKWILGDLISEINGVDKDILAPYKEFILEQAKKYNIR